MNAIPYLIRVPQTYLLDLLTMISHPAKVLSMDFDILSKSCSDCWEHQNNSWVMASPNKKPKIDAIDWIGIQFFVSKQKFFVLWPILLKKFQFHLSSSNFSASLFFASCCSKSCCSLSCTELLSWLLLEIENLN